MHLARSIILGNVIAGLAAASLLAAEACLDFSRYRSCPPPAARCTLGPNPRSCAQDCASCTADVDDDGDCAVDEELLNDADDDGDGLIDEDISCLNGCDPMGYECPPGLIDSAQLDLPDPIAATLRLDARANRWSCLAGDQIDDDLDLEVEPYPVNPRPYCGGFVARLRLISRSTGSIWYEGPASLVYSRRWESLESTLVPGATGNIQVFRWVLRADLRRTAAYAALPAVLRVPCNEDQNARKHLFFYGHLDLARDASRPTDRSVQRTALLLAHTPGRFTHQVADLSPAQELCGPADATIRGIPPGDPAAHDNEGWFVVAPGASFTFSATAPVLSGDRSFGRIRTVPNSPTEPCAKETRMCESQIEDPGPIAPCPSRIRYRHMRFCGQDSDPSCSNFNNSSLVKCDTIANDRVAFFPVGAWSGGEFPAPMSASAFEGGVACLSNFEPYWYGSHTQVRSPSLWLGPPDAIDVVDNQILRMNNAGKWLIGACNWVNEGTPQEVFRTRQFRTMAFFSSANPDIPTLAPCVAKAVATPAAAALCRGADLLLSGAASSVVNCCQCGGLERRWLRRNGTAWDVVQDWSTTASEYRQSPGPATDADYRLEVRCTTSRRVCVDSVEVPVRVHAPFTVDAGPDRRLCAGASTTLVPAFSGGTAPHRCLWTPATGLANPTACTTTATPAATTTYTVAVTDAALACATSDSLEVRVDPLPLAKAGGPGPLSPPVSLGRPPCDPGLDYAWTPASGLSSTTVCNPLANPTQQTSYCLVARDRQTGCESPPDCVTVKGKLCDVPSLPAAISRLLAIERGADVYLEWTSDALATGGYHVYRTEQKTDIPQSKTVGVLAVTTAPSSTASSGSDKDAVPPLGGERFFYQVVGVCADGLTEGPI